MSWSPASMRAATSDTEIFGHVEHGGERGLGREALCRRTIQPGH